MSLINTITAEKLGIIRAVQSYKQFVIDNYHARHADGYADWYSPVWTYFCSLPLPMGMEHDRLTLEHILNITKDEIELLGNIESERGKNT
jgi:hypothetical protein